MAEDLDVLQQDLLIDALQTDRCELETKQEQILDAQPLTLNISMESAKILGHKLILHSSPSTTDLLQQFAIETKSQIKSTGVKRKLLFKGCATPLTADNAVTNRSSTLLRY